MFFHNNSSINVLCVPKVFSTLAFVKKIPEEHDYKMFLQIQNKKIRSTHSLFCILKIFK